MSFVKKISRIVALSLAISFVMALSLTYSYAALQPANNLNAFVQTYMYEHENATVNITDTRQMENLSGIDTYTCLKFEDGGYAIIHSDTMKLSEYTLSGDTPFNWNEPRIIYAGPGNYLVPSELSNMARSNSIDYHTLITAEETFLDDAYTYAQVASDPLYNTITHSVTINGIQMNASTMMPYNFGSSAECLIPVYGESEYSLYSNGICGTTASAALLTFYQERVNPSISYFPASKKPTNRNADALKAYLFNYIDNGHIGGTTVWDVEQGLNNYFKAHGISGTCSAKSTIQQTSYVAISKLAGNRPLLIGVLEMSGATTGNHFMLCYKYTADLSLIVPEYKNVMFTCCRQQDANLNAAFTFSASWVGGVVYLNH